jgi:hypothetical protein
MTFVRTLLFVLPVAALSFGCVKETANSCPPATQVTAAAPRPIEGQAVVPPPSNVDNQATAIANKIRIANEGGMVETAPNAVGGGPADENAEAAFRSLAEKVQRGQ